MMQQSMAPSRAACSGRPSTAQLPFLRAAPTRSTASKRAPTACNAAAPAAAAAAGAKARQHAGNDRNPLLELQRLALEAQAEKDLWEAQLSQHELQQQQLKAQLDARARHQAHSRAALSTLRHLLHTARHVAREQHLAVFAESVHHCGRQRLRQERDCEREEHRAYVQASVDAAEQLQGYEATLTRMVGAVMASMAAAESLPLSLPPLITGDAPALTELEGPQHLAAPAVVPVLVAGRNNIVPRKPATAALLQRRAAAAAAHSTSA